MNRKKREREKTKLNVDFFCFCRKNDGESMGVENEPEDDLKVEPKFKKDRTKLLAKGKKNVPKRQADDIYDNVSDDENLAKKKKNKKKKR